MKVNLSEKIKGDLKALGVAAVYFFGSRARGDHFIFSDYDIGVVFVNPNIIAERGLDLRVNVYNVLTEGFKEIVGSSKLDISFLQLANPVLKIKAIKEGVVIFDGDPATRAFFEERAIIEYEDYLPLKNAYEEVTFATFR